MRSESLVSILMPAHNAEKYIQKAVDSIIDQTYSNWELLILNDGSTDGAANVLNQFSDSRIKVYAEPKNSGYLLSCNKLFKEANGDFITFLDADDTCPKTRIEDCLIEFENDPEIDFLTTNFRRIDHLGNPTSTHMLAIDYGRYATDSNYAPIICCATIFVRVNLLKKVGGYHTFFQNIGGEDYHWLFRLARAGKGFHMNKLLYYYRTHDEQSHHANPNLLKFYFSDIDKEIRTSLIESDIDLLETDSDLEKRWLQWIDDNPSDLLFRQASSMLNRNMPLNAVVTGLNGFFKAPFRFTSWHRLAYLMYSAIMR